jgi:hypothetical protein
MNHFKKLAILTLLLLPTHAFAYDEAVWEALAKRPDVEIKTEVDGSRTAYFKGGVEINESGKEWDKSGLGAVRCSWDMYVGVKNALEVCAPGTASAHIDYAIEKTRAFIVANNLTPITAADLDAEIAQKLEAAKAERANATEEKRTRLCTQNAMLQIEKSISAVPLEQFKQSIDAGLAVPRPPVSKPCL